MAGIFLLLLLAYFNFFSMFTNKLLLAAQKNIYFSNESSRIELK